MTMEGMKGSRFLRASRQPPRPPRPPSLTASPSAPAALASVRRVQRLSFARLERNTVRLLLTEGRRSGLQQRLRECSGVGVGVAGVVEHVQPPRSLPAGPRARVAFGLGTSADEGTSGLRIDLKRRYLPLESLGEIQTSEDEWGYVRAALSASQVPRLPDTFQTQTFIDFLT
ncbi:hypothetical protein BJ912DRAFT_1077939 [Pholiota molesta]|nr:hypothetical protein BJ912DRAFT_1077939 [Pholiota molesta]